jgi:hypothetical protein
MGRAPLERIAVNGVRWLSSWMRMKGAALVVVALMWVTPVFAQTNEARSLLLVVGAPGEEEFEKEFHDAAALWRQSALRGGFKITVVGLATNGGLNDRAEVLNALTNELVPSAGELWVVLLGHGTYDGRSAKFNLRGRDLAAEELAGALKNCQRSLAVIDCASASGPFLNALAGTNRVVVTATRSGYELNRTRFGEYLAKAVADVEADLDKDGQTSVLEAYLMASRQVDQFYRESGRLATEHALLDDNGDGLGTPAEWFVGVRAVRKAEKGKSVDGVRAHQLHFVRGMLEQQLSAELRAQRDQLERQLDELRERKPQLKEDEYYLQLEEILTRIARLYQSS